MPEFQLYTNYPCETSNIRKLLNFGVAVLQGGGGKQSEANGMSLLASQIVHAVGAKARCSTVSGLLLATVIFMTWQTPILKSPESEAEEVAF